MTKQVTVWVSRNRGMVAVDETRITNRETKWGVHHRLDEFKCAPGEVYSELVKRGYKAHASNIDTPGYGAPHVGEEK